MIQNLEPFNCGAMDQRCIHCGSYNFAGEALQQKRNDDMLFSICCGHGRVKLEPLKPPPAFLRQLLLQKSKDSKKFLQNIRAINSMLAFASLAVTDASIRGSSRAPATFRIQGALYHRVGALRPKAGDSPKFCRTASTIPRTN